MKQNTIINLATIAVLFAVSCTEIENPANVGGPEDIIVTIDQENGTKATLSDGDGSFRFTPGDEIRVHNGTAAYTGATVSNSNSGAFTMPEGFNKTTAGIVGFPASLVTAITSSTITFTIPHSYEHFSDVGSTNPNTCLAPVPMVGTYDAPDAGNNPKVTLKQAGAVVRIRVSTAEIGPGSITFTFSSNVAGVVTLSSFTPGTTAITSFTSGGRPDITVAISSTEWDEIAEYEYAYFTLPVPSGTKIGTGSFSVSVTYSNNVNNNIGALAPDPPVTISRAQGYRASVSLYTSTPPRSFRVGESTYVVFAPGNLMAKIGTYSKDALIATASEWKFGGYTEVIGDATSSGNSLWNKGDEGCIGKWIDLFSWQGASVTSEYRAHGLVRLNDEANSTYTGTSNTENLYTGCWETKPGNSPSDLGDYIYISNGGTYTWRPLNKSEMKYLLDSRGGATVGGRSGARFARATIAGMNGLLLFPDSDGEIWTESMGSVPGNINGTETTYNWGTDVYSNANMVAMVEAGIVFLPCPGLRTSYSNSIGSVNRNGYSWTSSSNVSGVSYAASLRFSSSDGVDPNTMNTRYRGRSVRLVREVDPPTP